MTQNIDESILRKIKKALALASNNPSAQEAETAMLKAQELLVKHGLSMSDVQDVNTAPANATKKEVEYGAGQMERKQWYKGRLANIIGDNFRCFTYFSNFGGGNMKMRFVGLKEDVEIATEVYSYAVEVIEYQAKQYLKQRKKEIDKSLGIDFKSMSLDELEGEATNNGIRISTLQYHYGDDSKIYKMRLIMAIKEKMGASVDASGMKNDFINGFLAGLKDKFKEQVEKNSWGLILVKDALVVQSYEKLDLKKGKASTAKASGDQTARKAGYEQGKKFNGAPKAGLKSGKQLK